LPSKAVGDGSIKPEEIESILASARTTEKPAVHELFALSYLGPFKEAGTLVGTSKVYTLDGRLEPEQRGETRSAFMGGALTRQRPVGDPDKLAVALLASLPGYRNVKPGGPHDIKIGDLAGVEVSAHAIDEDDNTPRPSLSGHAARQGRRIFSPDRHCKRTPMRAASSLNFTRLQTALRCCLDV